MQETWVRSLGLEDALGKEMATHSSILSWRIPWTEEPGATEELSRLQSMGSQGVGRDWTTTQGKVFLDLKLCGPVKLLDMGQPYVGKCLN